MHEKQGFVTLYSYTLYTPYICMLLYIQRAVESAGREYSDGFFTGKITK